MYDLIVIGGGPAGLAAACAAWESGARRILLAERDRELGGILNQCIHNGFGLRYFREELTGPEYAGRFVRLLGETGVEVRTDTMVLDVTKDRKVHMVGRETGYRVEEAKAVVLSMGCRERTRGALSIPGTRPAGVYTAGTAQRFVNMEGWLPGRRVVILGSGDIGLIMARRMTLEGAKVLCCAEVMSYSGGLTRNIVQCLDDFDIPLLLSHTVTEIRGERRVEGVTISKVDDNRMPIPGTEQEYDCDTLLLSVGLIPENELTRRAGIEIDPRTGAAAVYESMETSIPGVFSCGNAAHVHDLVDFVTEESRRAGAAAARFAREGEGTFEERTISVRAGGAVSYTVPRRIRPGRVEDRCELFFRVKRPLGKSRILVTSGSRELTSWSRERMMPGEMERIVLPRKLLEEAEGEILVSAGEVTES